MASTLFIINHAPYGSERAYNAFCGWPAHWRARTISRCASS